MNVELSALYDRALSSIYINEGICVNSMNISQSTESYTEWSFISNITNFSEEDLKYPIVTVTPCMLSSYSINH